MIASTLMAPMNLLPAQSHGSSIKTAFFKRMADGKEWTTLNLNVNVAPSFCYNDSKGNCRKYGRLYTWESAGEACKALGDRWRLPTNDEWRQLAAKYGGLREDAADGGKAAYAALLIGGTSGFNAVLGGGRDLEDKYVRGEHHGFYWTATGSEPGNAWFYNFGKGVLFLNRHNNGEKKWAFSVRCVRE